MAITGPNQPKHTRGVALLDPKGVVIGHHMQLGQVCPAYLFKGDKLYARVRHDVMIECERSQPIGLLAIIGE